MTASSARHNDDRTVDEDERDSPDGGTLNEYELRDELRGSKRRPRVEVNRGPHKDTGHPTAQGPDVTS